MLVKQKESVVSQLESSILSLMDQNTRHKGQHIYTVPSPDTYPFQWLWDSCFNAIIWSHFDTARAKAELRSLVSAQWKNGMIPHMIYWQRDKTTRFFDIQWGPKRTSSITQPPMLASAVWQIFQTDGDLEFVREMLPKIEKFHHYFFRFRDPRHHNLIGVINPDESGEDNSPRFDAALGLEPNQTFQANFSRRLKLVSDYRQDRFVIKGKMDQEHWVRDVPINCILIESLRLEAKMHEKVGQNAKARTALHRRRLMMSAMRTRLRDDGLYWSSVGLDYKLIKVKTWALFMPLFAGVASCEEASLAVQLLLDRHEFNTPYSVPTVALSEPGFNANGDWRGTDHTGVNWHGTNWRGPVWIGANWFVVKGLRHYGYDKIAKRLVQDCLDLIQKSGFREYYDPFTGEGHGARNFTWGGLVIDLIR